MHTNSHVSYLVNGHLICPEVTVGDIHRPVLHRQAFRSGDLIIGC